MRKNRALFSDIGAQPEAQSGGETGAGEGAGKKPNHLGKRVGQAKELGRDETVHKTLRRVDPERCKMWKHHNRRYELLNETRCHDLIEGIKAQGGQEFPAVVRRLKGDPDYDFEVICGARRHWSIAHLKRQHYDYKFLIDVRDLSDEEAFRLSDVENRDREDVSDYERSIDYKIALANYYDGVLSRMAARLEVSVSWLSRFLDLAELPDIIINAYADVTHINSNHAKVLKPLLAKKGGERAISERVLKRAGQLAEEQKAARAIGKAGPDGKGVIRALKEAAKSSTKSKKPTPKTYAAKGSGKPALEVKLDGKGGLTLRILPGSGADKAEVQQLCAEALNEHLA